MNILKEMEKNRNYEYYVCISSLSVTSVILIALSILKQDMIYTLLSVLFVAFIVLINSYHKKNEIDYITKLITFDHLKSKSKKIIKGDIVNCAIIDLERFSSINDSHGRSKGDTVMFLFAQRLREVIPINYLYSRNESKFVILSNDPIDVFEDNMMTLKSRLLNRYYSNFFINAKVAIVNSTSKNFDEVYENAEIKLKELKGKKAVDKSYIDLERMIRNAIAEDGKGFYLRYQPKINVQNGKIAGVEALIRFKDGDKEIYPDQFLPIVDELNLMQDITTIVLNKVCSDIKEIDTEIINNFAINITPPEFNMNLITKINGILEVNNIQRDLIQVEITEGSLITDLNLIKDTLTALKDNGYTIAVDDFGTGNTCFKNLIELRNLIDIIKIDKYFTDAIDKHKSNYTKIFIELADTNKSKIVFEGVENKSQFEYLKSLSKSDNTIIQGYLISKPLLLNELKGFINKYNPDNPF